MNQSFLKYFLGVGVGVWVAGLVVNKNNSDIDFMLSFAVHVCYLDDEIAQYLHHYFTLFLKLTYNIECTLLPKFCVVVHTPNKLE